MSPPSHLVSVDPDSLYRLLAELVPVQTGGATVVLLLSVCGAAVVRPEEGSSSGVPSQLHLSELLPSPVSVQVGGPDEGQMDPERPDVFEMKSSVLFCEDKLPVNPTAVDTDKYPVRYGGPCRVLGSAVETDLIALS